MGLSGLSGLSGLGGLGLGSGGAAVVGPWPVAPAAWFRADTALFQSSAGTTPAAADNDPVRFWGDLSGNGRNLTQSLTSGNDTPGTLKLNQVNGKPAIVGDGVNTTLQTAAFTLAQPFSMFVVLKQIVFSGGSVVWCDGGGQVSGGESLSPGTPDLSLFNVSGQEDCATSGLAIGSWGLYTSKLNADNSTVQINGNAPTAMTHTGSSFFNPGTNLISTGLVLFDTADDGPNGLNSNIAIAEAVLFGTLTAGQRTAVIGYLNSKYALY